MQSKKAAAQKKKRNAKTDREVSLVTEIEKHHLDSIRNYGEKLTRNQICRRRKLRGLKDSEKKEFLKNDALRSAKKREEKRKKKLEPDPAEFALPPKPDDFYEKFMESNSF